MNLHYGRFEIAKELVDHANTDSMLFKLFANIIVTRCELVFPNKYSYIGFSPQYFEELEEGELAPLYDITFYENGKIDVERRRNEL